MTDSVRKWRPSLGGYFNTNEANLLVPALRGDLLDLIAASDMVKSIVDKEEIRDFVTQRSGALLHRPIRVRVVVRGARRGEDDPMNRLVSIGREHPELFHVTE